MAITNTNLHVGRVADQCYRNLIGLQIDIRRNAETHKTMALAQSPPFNTLLEFLNSAILAYQTRLQWFQTLNDTPSKITLLQGELTKRGWVLTDLTTPFQELKAVVQAMNNAAKTNYEDIISICNNVIANVDYPESLWPEI